MVLEQKGDEIRLGLLLDGKRRLTGYGKAEAGELR
jgi:hypothetical protein